MNNLRPDNRSISLLSHEQTHYYLHLGRDQLAAAEQMALDAHLAGCPICRRYAAEVTDRQTWLAETMRLRWKKHQPGPVINSQVQTHLRRKIWQRQVWHFANSVTAGAATLILVAALGWLVWHNRPLSSILISRPTTALVLTQPPASVPGEWRKPPGLTTFGDMVKLLGFSVSPTSLQPDEVAHITLYWSARPTPPPYYIFIHLLNSATNLVAQADLPLMHNSCAPTGRFSEGMFVACYPVTLAVPPGRYQLIVGVYDPATGQKLLTQDGAETFLLTTLEVGPLPTATAPPTPTSAPAPTPYPIPASCPVTLPNGNPPPGQPPYPTHHGNGQLWTNLLPDGVLVPPENIRPDGKLTYNWWWWRGQTGQLTITGRQLDDLTVPPLEAEIIPGFGNSGYQDSWLIFPGEGCWEVTGQVGDSTLTFVTWVVKAPEKN
jgi:hypothetical protein